MITIRSLSVIVDIEKIVEIIGGGESNLIIKSAFRDVLPCESRIKIESESRIV